MCSIESFLYISGASVILLLLPAMLFLSKSEIAVVLGFRSMVSYKSTRTVTFFLILQTLKSKYVPNIDKDNFEELLSESEEVRAVSYDLLRRIVFGMAAYFVAGVIMTFILLNEKGCF
jgi:hypothetical protein